ncbi:RNA-binding protein 12B-like [Rhinophrynus dorsalis]
MSVVIRLQGLPVEANSIDIRQFFNGLDIPKGNIYIIGGRYGEAFIIFATYGDARRSISWSGREIKNSKIHLAFSSESEMQQALEHISGKLALPATYPIPGNKPETLYLYLHGMPPTATKVEIRDLFGGLSVEDVIFLKFPTGVRNGNAIVKFATSTDAFEGLKRNRQYMGFSPISIMASDESEWLKVGGRVTRKREHSPLIPFKDRKRIQLRPRSPVHRRARARSPYEEFFVHIINLPYSIHKRDIKVFFGNLAMKDSHITFLYDKYGKRTREAFVMLTSKGQYEKALDLHNELCLGRPMSVYSISRRAMMDLLDHKDKKSSTSKERSLQKDSTNRSSQAKSIYLRNLSFDVSKSDIQRFFAGFSINEENIFVLYDDKGVGLGEALVIFSNEKEAAKAEKLDHQKFMETEVLLRCITDEQVKAFGVDPVYKGKAHSPVKEKRQSDECLETVSQPFEQDCTEWATALEEPQLAAVSEDTTLVAASDDAALVAANDATLAATSDGAVLAAASNQVALPAASDGTKWESSLHPPNPKQAYGAESMPAFEMGFKKSVIANCHNEQNLSKKFGGNQSGVTLVFIRNLPFTVTVAEILDFFYGYQVSSVNLQQIEKGTATVRMKNYEEAVSAVRELDNRPVGLKKVSLSLM